MLRGYVGGVQSLVFQAWSPTGSQAIDWVAQPIPGFGPMHRGSQTLIRVCTHPRFQVWAPTEVSGVGPQSANLGVRNRASGELGGCLSRLHSPGAEGGGAPEAMAAVASSLTSR